MAADLPADLRGRLAELQRDLSGMPLPVRWVEASGIHLTLKFLGEVPAARLEEIETALAAAGGGLRAFRLEATRAVPFPSRGAPRIIWVEVRGDLEDARVLASALDAAAARLGFPPETREFRAHLTLGRVKGPAHGDWRASLERVAGAASGPWSVTHYVLYESRLDPRGAIYAELRRFPLAGEAVAGGET